ncbi:cytochrome c oxidase subunit 6B, putative [Plasmodium malariae]|uniref:Cytochrome c oxidase subunit 6B, putative n=1 Tax=Plasmodium malariae TaxID=5858 RepID=A0A1A8VU91_PLAMA|nr:cytochrome c oxidase subunit 6B, putative [Plasmodium malariae]
MSESNYLSHKFIKNYDELTSQNPHASDPRFLQVNQFNHCAYRYTLFCRCARELGEENPRCNIIAHKLPVQLSSSKTGMTTDRKVTSQKEGIKRYEKRKYFK